MAFTAFIRFFLASSGSLFITNSMRAVHEKREARYKIEAILFDGEDDKPQSWSKELWVALDDTVHTLRRIPKHWKRVGQMVQDSVRNFLGKRGEK